MRLSLAAPALPRLVAPGAPDWIGADGARLGWVLRDVLFVLDGDGVETLRLPDLVDDVCATPAGWTLATAYGAVRVAAPSLAPGPTLTVDQGEPLAVQPGADCALVVAVPSHTLVRLADGVAVPLPDAATRARLHAPFATGVGALWIDLDQLYRMREGRQPAALGAAAGASALVAGPDGVALVALADDTLCVPARGGGRRLGHAVDVASARFSADGRRVLVADEEGVAELDVDGGKELRRWDGELSPVGYAPGPVRWDHAAGELLDEEGRVLLAGFAGAAPARAGELLAGPGGATWRLGVDAPLRRGLGDGVAATDGERVVVVDDTSVRVVDGETFAHDLVQAEDDAVERAGFVDGALVARTLEGRAAAFTLGGECLWRREAAAELLPDPPAAPGLAFAPPSEPSEARVDGRAWPLPADGGAHVGDGVWLWSSEGLLVAVPG